GCKRPRCPALADAWLARDGRTIGDVTLVCRERGCHTVGRSLGTRTESDRMVDDDRATRIRLRYGYYRAAELGGPPAVEMVLRHCGAVRCDGEFRSRGHEQFRARVGMPIR